MYNSKADVDRHVRDILNKFKSDSEIDKKCYVIAKLYVKVKDYENAIKYLNRYSTNVGPCAQTLRLLGECYENQNKISKALEAYRASIELDGKQTHLITKVCELLCNPELSLVGTQVRYWLDRLQGLIPHHPTVFKLKERLLHNDPDKVKDPMELEKLILSEIMARPLDPGVRIRFFNLLLDMKKVKLAQTQAGDLLSRGVFHSHLPFYECLKNVAEVYEQEGHELNLDFQLHKLSVLERHSYLTLEDCGTEKRTIQECTSAVFNFDQGLNAVSQFQPKPAEKTFFQSAVGHFRYQLAFHLALLKLRRTKKEPGEWTKATSLASPLLLFATQPTSVEGHYETFHRDWWIVDGAERVSVASHVLRNLEKGNNFLQEIQQSCGGKWRQRTYEKLFNSADQQASATSCFLSDPAFLNMPVALPTDSELSAFDKESQSAHPQSLHHSVWLGLVNITSTGLIREEFRCEVVPELPLTSANLNQCGPQSLSQLDVDAFLYAAVFCSKSQSRIYLSSGRPSVLPVTITEQLCTEQQMEWWNTMFERYMNQASSSEALLRLRRGIETTRALGNHRLHPKLLVLLAKQFELRANAASDAVMKEALEKRADAFWSAAVPLLERVEKRQFIKDVSAKLFEFNPGDWEPADVRSALEDGKLFLGCQLMNKAKYEDAIEAFQQLKNPYATYYQAKIYTKLARELMNREAEAVTSEHRSQYMILLTRARDSLRITDDRLKRPTVSNTHPLHALLRAAFDEVDQDLSRFEEDGRDNRSRYETESDMAVANSDHLGDLSTWSQNYTDVLTPRLGRQVALGQTSSTPRGAVRQFQMPRTDVPNPIEVIDSQLKQLLNTQESILDETRMLRSDNSDVKSLLRDLLSEFKKLSVKLDNIGSEQQHSHHQQPDDDLKPEDLFEFPGEEEYPTDEFAQFPSLQQQLGTAAARNLQQFLPPMFPMQRADHASLMQYYPGLMWSPGLPFSEGQQLPDFRGIQHPAVVPPVALPQPAPLPAVVTPVAQPYPAVAADKKQVPNVVITSSDTLPTYTSGSQPAMSVTIPPQHVRGNMHPMPHQFQISLPTTPAAPPAVTQSPSDKYQARAYDPLPAANAANSVSPKPILWTPSQLTKQQTPLATPPQVANQQTPQATPQQVTNQKPLKEATPALVANPKQDSPVLTSLLSTPSSKASLFQFSSSKPSTVQSTPISFATPKTPPSALNSSKDDSYTETEYDPRPDFQAIVNLPVVEVRTGEEEESSFFSSNARLYVFRQTEWKERGTGVVKILHNEKTSKVRLLMRRDQIHKICANHLLLPEIKLEAMPKVNNAFIWAAADFSDQEVKNEKFCIKFKTLDEAKDFEFAFNKGLEISAAAAKSPVKTPEPIKPPAETAKSPAESTKPTPITPAFSFGVKPAASPLLKTPVFGAPKEGLLKTPVFGGAENDPLMSDKPVFGQKATSVDFTSLAKVGSVAEAFKPNPVFTGFAGAGKQLFTGNTPPVAKNGTPESPGGEDKVEEYEPSQDFTPVVPLPDLVEVKTGEEEEIVLYQQRAKVLRFASDLKEWKEKGVGTFKILKHPVTEKIRLLMRREQVHKVCCNHYLEESMKFEKMTSSDKAATWTAQDFSEEEYKPELLAIRFGRVESLNEFLQTIHDLQKEMKASGGAKTRVVATNKAEPQKSLSEMFKKAEGTWDCDMCLVRNKPEDGKCASCETPRPGGAASGTGAVTTTQVDKPKPLSEMFKKAVGSWDCDMCLVRNKPEDTKCASCETIRPGAVDNNPKSVKPQLPASGFTFGIPSSATTAVFAPTSTVVTTTVTAPAFSFGVTSTTPSKPVVFGANKTASPASFSFGVAAGTTATGDSAPKFVFGGVKTEPVTPVKGSGDFKIGVTDKAFSFTFKKPVENAEPVADSQPDEADESVEDVEREDETLTFKPVVPLPAKVALHTGEEDEDVLYCQRTKLYRFVDGEWKERGLGDIKILKHRETNKIRFLMRREQVHKICLNHYLSKEIEFTPKDARSWLWAAPDYSEGTVENMQFCARFRNSELAQEFLRVAEKERSELVDSPQSITQRSPAEDDPSIVYEYEGTPAQQKAARDLKLPPNFYRYLEKERCTGCEGCEPDSESDSEASAAATQVPKVSSVKTPLSSTALSTPTKVQTTKQAADSTNSEVAKSEPLLKFGLLPKPSETIFGAKKEELPKEVEPEKPQQQETPKSSLFASFSFKNVELPKNEKQPTIFGSSAGNIFGGLNKSQGTSLFGGSAPASNLFGSQTPSIFGGGAALNTSKPPGLSGSLFGGTDGLDSSKPVFTASPALTFSQIANQEGGNAFGKSAPGWSTDVKPIFGAPSKKKEDSDEEGEGHEDEEHDPQFKPIVELPPLVEVQTGEEGEEVMFKARAKLYRYDDNTKEWKERGIGDLKVLHDPSQGSYRLLLRREQVHKVVLNMRITLNMDLQPKPNNSKSLFWAGMNYAEGNNGHEKLAVRFKLDSEAEQFKTAVDKCVADVKESSLNSSKDCSVSTAIAVDLTNNSFGTALDSTVEATAEEESDESAEDYDEEDQEDYDEGGDSIILIKENVILYALIEETEKYQMVADNCSIEIMETNRGLRILVQSSEDELFSDSIVIPGADIVFKIPPRTAMWVAEDRAFDEPRYRNLLVELSDADDAEDLFLTVDATDLPDAMHDTFRRQRSL